MFFKVCVDWNADKSRLFKPRFHLFSKIKSVIFFWQFKISIALHLKRKVKRLFKPKFYLSKNQRLFNLFSNSKCVILLAVFIQKEKKRMLFYSSINRRPFKFSKQQKWFFSMFSFKSTELLLKGKGMLLFS